MSALEVRLRVKKSGTAEDVNAFVSLFFQREKRFFVGTERILNEKRS